MLMINLPAADMETPPGGSDEIAAYTELREELEERGVYLGGHALQPPSVTTRVRVRDDETLLVDAPLVETSEMVAGYFLVDCRDLDEAIAIAARIPGAKHGSVDVRPVWEHD